jgi:hypothetical protein
MPLPRLHAYESRVGQPSPSSATPAYLTVANDSAWPRGALQPAPYTQAVVAVEIAELALEIGFLAGHDAVADDQREGHQHLQQPEIVERDGQADLAPAAPDRVSTIVGRRRRRGRSVADDAPTRV